jgi:putative ABC transport system permease protein
MLLNLKITVRKLLKRPVFSVTTVLCLALGIGATTAIGSLILTLFFQSASVQALDRLVFFMSLREGVEPFGVSPIEIEAYPARSHSFRSLGFARTLDGNSVNLTGGDRAERVRAAQGSTAYFQTLGVEAESGRLFSPEEERSGGPGALLLSHRVWVQRFGADREILGRSLRVDGESRTVVGILPPRFDLPSKTDLWIPLALDFDRLTETERGSHSYMMVGRLADGATRESAIADLVQIARQLETESPRTNKGWSVTLTPFRNLLLGDLRGSIRVMVEALAGAVALLLLIACVNAAHLFLARCIEQERDLALSSALGASRGTLFRQLFLENLLLALIAGILGSAVALGIVPLLLATSSIHEGAYTNFFRTVAIDSRLLLFALVASVLTAFLFGSLPLVGFLAGDLSQALRSGGREGASRSHARWSRILVGAEVAISAALLVGAGLLVRSLDRLSKLDLGFRPESLVSIDFTLADGDFPDRRDRVAFSERVLDRVRALLDVSAAGGTTDVPLRLGTWNSRYLIEGAPPPREGEVPWAAFRAVTSGYLESLGVTLVSGRTFTAEDRDGAEKVAVVTEELARRMLGGGDPVGRRIGHPDEIATEDGWWRIVGVIKDVKEDRYNFRLDRPVWYVPYEQLDKPGNLLNLVLRTDSSPAGVGAEVRRVVSELYPTVAPGEVLEIGPHVASVVAAERTATLVALVLAALGTLLASIGLYGVLAYSVRRRAREMGLRLAVGASPGSLSGLVVRDGLKWTAIGLAAGFVAALSLGRILSNLLFETSPWDPATFALVGALFLGVAALSCWLPARRAAATNPVDALRMD